MNELISFLDHGLLPFVGRQEEIERILRFWEGTTEAFGLRTLLLQGEAGIGKSRLLDEVAREVESRGGLLLRLKLIPEETGSIASLLAESLSYHPVARPLLGVRPEGTIGSLLPALRRLSRLRSTLLIIEDIHLLEDESSREFSVLLDGLTEETLSILAAARTTKLSCRGAIESSLVEEIALSGLKRASIEGLVRRVFGRPPVPTELETLGNVTGGNPLALRGTLRSLIGDGERESGVVSPINPQEIRRITERRVSTFIEGMVPHLDREELHVAARIAPLGEIFPLESGLFLIDGDRAAIDALVEKGILVESDRHRRTLPGASSAERPLAFTHSLLHHYFLEQEGSTRSDLLRVIGRDLPLTSLLPLQSVRESTGELALKEEILRSAIERINTIARHLNGTSDWERAVEIWEIGWGLFEEQSVEDRRLEAVLRETRLWLMNGRLGTLTQGLDESLYRHHLDRLFALTEEGESTEMAARRIDACRHQHQLMIDSYPECLDVWDDVDTLIEEHPPLLISEAHLQFLAFAARTIARYGDVERCRRLKSRLRPFLEQPEVSEEIRLRAYIHVALPLLHAYTTPEELEENMRLAESAEEELLYRNNNVAVGRTSFENAYGGLLFVSGRMTEARVHAERAESLCADLGHAAGLFQNRLTRLAIDGALGMESAELLDEARSIHHDLPIARHPHFTRMIGMYLAEIGLLRNEISWVEEVFAEFAPEAPHHYIEADAILALEKGTQSDLLPIVPTESGVGHEVGVLLHTSLGQEEYLVEGKRIATSWLTLPILSTSDLLRFVLLMKVLPTLPKKSRTSIATNDQIRSALESRLEWLAERELFRPMLALLDLCKGVLPKKVEERWRAESNRIGKEWKEKRESRSGGDRLQITMIGTMSVTTASGETMAVRGGRIKTLLGLLVAAEMLEFPLTRDEYHQIASGEIEDPNLARKNTNMAAVRLRELLGSEVIRSGEERHELIRDRLEVDLLEADDLLRTSMAALQSRSLLRAAPALLKALQITRGEVPFPGLYSDFFESLRDDFEARLRRATLDISVALLAEKDAERAEEILRIAFEAMPEDEELAELLEQALGALGKRTEATRVRYRSE